VGFGKSGLSLVLTIGILVVLGLFAGGSRRDLGREPAGAVGEGVVAAGLGAEVTDGVGRVVPASGDGYVNPLEPAPKAEWEVLTGCVLVRTPTNSAHHFRVECDGKPTVFQLYFVESPEPTEPGEEEVDEQSRYFGWPSKWTVEERTDRSIALGQQAWQLAEKLLSERPFLVLTKYELKRESHFYYGLVVLTDAHGRLRTLQECLVEQGLGMVTRPALGWLPIQASSEQFATRLERLEQLAQRERRGGWTLPVPGE